MLIRGGFLDCRVNSKQRESIQSNLRSLLLFLIRVVSNRGTKQQCVTWRIVAPSPGAHLILPVAPLGQKKNRQRFLLRSIHNIQQPFARDDVLRNRGGGRNVPEPREGVRPKQLIDCVVVDNGRVGHQFRRAAEVGHASP